MPAPSLWRFMAIGVPWEVQTARPLPSAAREAAASVIADFDRDWSRFRDDSTVARLAAGAGELPAPPDAEPMLARYRELSEATDGAVNPLVGDALARRGYDAAVSLVDRGPTAIPRDWTARLRMDSGMLRLQPPAMIDVGALGKGRLVDRVLDVLAPAAGAEGIVVDASGDLRTVGMPQRVGLEHPYDPRRAIGVWEVSDAALCASAINRRAWGDGLHHVLDARTGEPVRTVAATWAVASDAMTADALATALFFDGGPALAARWGAEWVRMTTDGRVEWSPGCAADLFVRR
jgi:thiamine biosynthesis lipoprotein